MSYAVDISPDVLDAGRWVFDPRTRIMRWLPEVAPVERRRPTSGAAACSTCGATVTETCKTRRGQATKDHAARVGTRQCPCGADVERFKNYCEPCRVEARRVTWRKQAQKKRALDECAQRREDAAADFRRYGRGGAA